MSNDLAIGIDIGGTKVAGGVVDGEGRVIARARRDTPHRSTAPHVVEDVIVDAVKELLAAAPSRPVAIGIGAAGFVSSDRATVVFAPHLSWRHEPLREALGQRLDLPISIDNDANAALWAEHRFGAARGTTHAVMITLGTGIGGAILVGGHLVRVDHELDVLGPGRRIAAGELVRVLVGEVVEGRGHRTITGPGRVGSARAAARR